MSAEVAGSGTAIGAVDRNPETSGMLHENWKAPAESNLEINEFELSVPLLTYRLPRRSRATPDGAKRPAPDPIDD